MKKLNYKVYRDSIFVGQVVSTNRVMRYEGNTNFFNVKPGQLKTGNYHIYRSILFVPNEKNFSTDLLYNSPSYPILNITDDETCLNLKSNSIVISDSYNLNELLKYFGYSDELSFEDIVKIRKTFFDGKFVFDNCELFGKRELKPDDYIYYRNGIEITNSIVLKALIFERMLIQKLFNNKKFSGISEHSLPREYWDILRVMGNNSLRDVYYGFAKRIDSFIPDKHEGKIKKLSKF